jgi:DNA polymerase I
MAQKPEKETNQSEQETTIEGAVLDVDYLMKGDESTIRLTVKGSDGIAYEIFDTKFKPYFYFVPTNPEMPEGVMKNVSADDTGAKLTNVEKERRRFFGKEVDVYRIFVKNTMSVPKLSAAMARYGKCYEYDIPFARRYVIDKRIVPLVQHTISFRKEGRDNILVGAEPVKNPKEVELNVLCFDIEVYNPLVRPRLDVDPVIMISYNYVSRGKTGTGVITYKKIDLPFVELVDDEISLIRRFASLVNELDIDIVTGYNSANFDIMYLLERSRRLKIDFNISRFEGDTKIENHGLVDKVKIAGRTHVDMYVVTRFVAVVGASEFILKMNDYTLKNVYEAISKGKKLSVEKAKIHELWDGDRNALETLAKYNLDDSHALMTVYNALVPISIALTKTTGNLLSDVAVSTAGQLVEFVMMRYAHQYGELIPNKPEEGEMKARSANPIEGAYVKTPEPGIYEKLAVFDFRGLYPSIIISHNIDPSTICIDCTDYYEAPTGTRFDKARTGITPMILKMFIEQRTEVKKQFKKNPDNLELGSRSQALKIVANSFYGYLGYARSRWYSRDCAAAVTAYGRQYIKDTISSAEQKGFRVLYSDTDSILMLLGDKSKSDALGFMKDINSKLPEMMELEFEDFYARGVFVGKKTTKSESGAKKKYALISESGRVKIRGFELVRRDWSKIARETQRKVLEAILKEGSKEKAAEIVKDVVKRLNEGAVPLSELVISTQLRKGIDAYDAVSPELMAAKKAVEKGFRTRDEVEHAVIGYIITRHGSSISDKALLEGMATDYDPSYYIDHQVLPATMRILKELDFNEDELKGFGKQKKL